MPLPLASRFAIPAVFAALEFVRPGVAQQSPHAGNSGPAVQTVYTMKGEFDIQGQSNGRGYVLRRLSKGGTPYETIAVTRVSATGGEAKYVDQSGKRYTVLADGRLEEEVTFEASAPAPAVSGYAYGPVPRLMDTPPKVPLSYGASPMKLSNLTLPSGENALRSAGGLVFLTTGVDARGRHREVVVQQVAERWYIRTSVSDDPNEAPIFRLEEDGSVSGFSQMPPGVPHVSAIIRGTDSAMVSPPVQATGEMSVEYAGRKGAIVTRADEKGVGTYLRLDGDPDPIELESVRGSKTLFTPRGREDVLVHVDRTGKVTVSDSQGRPASLRATPAAPAILSQTGETEIEYQGKKGRITRRSDGTGGGFSLSLDGAPGTLELEPVRGSNTLFTPRGRDDIFVNAGKQGKLTVTDSRGVPVSLKDIGAVKEPAPVEANAPQGAVPATRGAASAPRTADPGAPTRPVQPNSVQAPVAPAAAYSGPMSGTLTCEGNPIPQNGEYVFSRLPAAKLDLVYDPGTWEVRTVGDGETQRVIIKNRKPGAQKKCTIHWKVIP